VVFRWYSGGIPVVFWWYSPGVFCGIPVVFWWYSGGIPVRGVQRGHTRHQGFAVQHDGHPTPISHLPHTQLKQLATDLGVPIQNRRTMLGAIKTVLSNREQEKQPTEEDQGDTPERPTPEPMETPATPPRHETMMIQKRQRRNRGERQEQLPIKTPKKVHFKKTMEDCQYQIDKEWKQFYKDRRIFFTQRTGEGEEPRMETSHERYTTTKSDQYLIRK